MRRLYKLFATAMDRTLLAGWITKSNEKSGVANLIYKKIIIAEKNNI